MNDSVCKERHYKADIVLGECMLRSVHSGRIFRAMLACDRNHDRPFLSISPTDKIRVGPKLHFGALCNAWVCKFLRGDVEC